MTLAIILLLVIIIVILMIYNVSIHKKIESFSNLNQKVTSLNVLQDLLDTISEYTTTKEKFNKINNILIQKYGIKYSTIVIYDGTEYVVKASNVDKKHWDTLSKLQTESIFKDSIQTATPKYLTVEREGERLPYQKSEFARAKSAIFFPLYIDNVYIGYWIIEGTQPHEFDNLDVTILDAVKNNIVSVVKTVTNQQIIENIVREDKFSGLKSVEYLYGDGRKIIDKYTISAVCLFKIINIEEINNNINRETGNNVITQVSQTIKDKLQSEYIFVRYMGPKFAIIFSGIDPQSAEEILKEIKESVEELKISPVENNENQDYGIYARAKLNFAVAAYYKGTALEEVMRRLEEYLDNADKEENSINFL